VIIKNFNILASDKTRGDALKIINSGIESVLVKPLIQKQITLSENTLKIKNHSWNLSKYNRIFVVGAGKAAADMAETIEDILGSKISAGIVIDTRTRKLKRIKVIKGTHPLPTKINIEATEKIIKILNNSGENDLIIALISGGGSSLMVSSRIKLKKLIELNKMMLKRGATINEINTVRKHISNITGGQLAKLAAPAELISLIVSDVITNNLDVIASGPTVKDTTTIKDAVKIQKKYNLPSLPFIETPKEKPKKVANILLVTNVYAAEAMKKEAIKIGYKSKILTTQLKGEARLIGVKLAKLVKSNCALIATGETTVNVKGNGMGGRNQELVLAASKFINKGVIISCSSDGVDYISQAGGAIADKNTKEQAKKYKLNADEFLKNNNSYNFLKRVNGIIITGKTGTNIGDLFLVLGEKTN